MRYVNKLWPATWFDCFNSLEQEADSGRSRLVHYCANTATYWLKRVVQSQWKRWFRLTGGQRTSSGPTTHSREEQHPNILPKAEARPYICASVFIKKQVNKELDYNHARDFYTLMWYNSKKKIKLPKTRRSCPLCVCVFSKFKFLICQQL